MKHKPMPDLNFLRSILEYNPDTGEFIRKICTNNKHKIGEICGFQNKRDKYMYIRFCNILYLLHRLAYYYITGIDPTEKEIDHINGNKLNNKFYNLRISKPLQNSKNRKMSKANSSGFKGVYWHKGKWQVSITINYKIIHLGYYDSKLYAALVRARAEKHYFGEWRRDRKHING